MITATELRSRVLQLPAHITEHRTYQQLRMEVVDAMDASDDSVVDYTAYVLSEYVAVAETLAVVLGLRIDRSQVDVHVQLED